MHGMKMAKGGWLTPTKSEGNTRLEEIKKVIDEYK